ncbi:hypothetical protein TrRE_jg3958 [Triparma retinervis]|uniref:Uncharacterized protein n=1 Tax=Triparma retinervis TaxID=2557542 RepID=A0A9W6ZD03_9STRA|nr:hypothetical protein TrRE_jg3958 [Triparma retinervis]
MHRSSSLGDLDVSSHYSLGSSTSATAASTSSSSSRHPLRKRIYSFESPKSRPRSWWLIPSDSPWKMLWDMTTFLITLYSFYLTNLSISTRSYEIKSFFRTKGVVKVTRVLRGRHFKLFGQLSRKTKHIGMGSSKLLKSLIKYLPKYIMFLRRMKIIIPLRLARGYHVIRKLAKDFFIWGGQVKREVGGRVRVRRERLRVAVREVGGRWSPVRDPNTHRVHLQRRDRTGGEDSPPPLSLFDVVKAAGIVDSSVNGSPPSTPPSGNNYQGRRNSVAEFPHLTSPPSPPKPTLKRRNTTSNLQ